MVTADFGPEPELTLFLHMRAKNIAKSLGKFIPIEELGPYSPITINRGRRGERQGQVSNSRFRACEVKIVL